MKKKRYLFIILFLLIGFISGCATTENSETTTKEEKQVEAVQEEKITVILSVDDGQEQIEEKEIPIEEGAILMDVMKEHFTIEEEGGFIHSIDGIAPAEDEEKAWMYFVNGEMAKVGAQEFELSPGDEVTFDLQSWE